MCWFIHLKITSQGKADAAEAAAKRLADEYGVCLRGSFPALQITNGHCSCDYVQHNNRALSVADLLATLARTDAIKNIAVGWTWGMQMPPEAVVERLPFAEFLARNADADLKPDTWYRLHDPDKFGTSSWA